MVMGRSPILEGWGDVWCTLRCLFSIVVLCEYPGERKQKQGEGE